MAIKLFFAPYTRSTRPRWALEELGIPHELVRIDPNKREQKSASYLKVNPLGHLPALQDGETTILESGAIVMYLADRYGAGRLAPALNSPERGEYYQWILLTHATLEPALQPINDTRLGRQVDAVTLLQAKQRAHQVLTVIDHKLNGRPFAVGSSFTAADLVLASAFAWGNMMGQLHDFPRLQAYVARQLSRPAAKKAREA